MKKMTTLLLIVAALALALVLWLGPREKTAPAPTVAPTATAAPAPTPSPSPTPTPSPEPTPAPLSEAWFGQAVFIGDSVTRALENHCRDTGELGEAVFLCAISLSVRNIVEDRLGVEFRGEERPTLDALAEIGASRVFIMLGTNDVALTGGIDGAMDNWKLLLDGIRERCPDMEIYVESVLPMYSEGQLADLNNQKLGEYNARLRDLCREQGCLFLDLAPRFMDAAGGLRGEYSSDGYVHLTKKGAALWASLLRSEEIYEAARNQAS